jgi:hypothetical protein
MARNPLIAPNTYYQVALQRLSDQVGEIRGIDAKLVAAVGLASAILGVFGGLITAEGRDLPPASEAMVFLAIAFYIVILALGFFGYVILNRWSFRPDLATFREYCSRYGEGVMQGWVADECLQSIESNEPRVLQKAWAALYALALLPLQAGALIAASLVVSLT